MPPTFLVTSRLAWKPAASAALVLLVAACSSSSKSADADAGFGFGDNDSGTRDAGHEKKDTGAATKKDTGTTGPMPGDAGCGAALGSTWCQTNAPMLTESSNVICDDFDIGTLSNAYGYIGVGRSSYVGTHYVSPYCGLHTFIGDGGGYPSPGDAGFAPVGSFTEHAYTLVPGAASATLAFDLFVPSGVAAGSAACEGAVVARFDVSGSATNSRADAATLWLSISDVNGSIDGGAGYTLTLNAQVETGASGGTVSSVTTKVTPRASDHGWARLEINASAYSITKNPSSLAATASWFYPTDKTAQGTSTMAAATGSVTSPTASAAAFFDVGVIGDPASGVAPGGCEVFVDNFVSNVITN